MTPCTVAHRTNYTSIIIKKKSSALLVLPSILFPHSQLLIKRKIQFLKREKKEERKLLIHVQLLATPWAIQSMEFSKPEYWSEEPFPSPEDLPRPGIEPRPPALQADSSPAEPQGKHALNLYLLRTSLILRTKYNGMISYDQKAKTTESGSNI